MTANNLLLVGCGILEKEVRWLVEKNHWPLDTAFLDSALHVDFHKLARSLTDALGEHADRRIVVFYGDCHPRMDAMLAERGLPRLPGQNCIEMLLGRTMFTDELADGAFFLLEDWARRWDCVVPEAMGTNPTIVRRIFQSDRRCLLGLRTPCSGDFTAEARQVAEQIGLPLRWIDVSLDHLETLLQEAIQQDAEGATCQR